MKYLIDIGHPAHVHYFKNFALNALKNNNKVLFTTRDKEITIDLLEYYNFNYVCFGRNYKSIPGKIFGLFLFTLKLFFVAVNYRPDVYLNASMYSAIVSWIFRKPHISLEDTFNFEQVNLYLPFTNCVLTGGYEHPSLGKKEIKYKGYQELLYLHPNRFKPDKRVMEELGVFESEKYVIVRFVSWNASHDFGHSGISLVNKVAAVRAFSEHAKVFVTSESYLPKELEQYRFNLPPERMHHAMAYASLIYGESSTMVSEGAMLGVPGIYLNNKSTFLTQNLEKDYGLVFNFTESVGDQTRSIQKGVDLLCTYGAQIIWDEKRRKMLDDKIDPTSLLCWFVENYPNSFRIMKENPDYQNRFK